MAYYIIENKEFKPIDNEEAVIRKLRQPNALIYTEAQKKAFESYKRIGGDRDELAGTLHYHYDDAREFMVYL